MLGYRDLNLGFEEAQLPLGQELIRTENVIAFDRFVRLMLETKPKTGYSTMGVVTGRAGVGKTIAIWAYLNSLQPLPHTGLPACTGIRVKPNSTPKALVEDLLTSFGENVPRLNRYKIADEAAKALIGNDLKLLFVDEADQLNVDGFEFLRYIFDKTGCPIVIVGLPSIMHVIKPHEKFASRVGAHLKFLAPTEEEVLQTILPKLVFPRWTFDATSEADRAIGRELRKRARSLRELRTLLEIASQLAEKSKHEKITLTILRKAFEMRANKGHPEEADEQEEDVQPDPPQTEYEVQSQQRQDAKKKHTHRTDEQ